MGYVVSLSWVPPARYDGVPWTVVRFEEAPTPSGPWVQIDEQPLANPDTNPASPALRNVTTAQATLEVGWDRLIVLDAAGNQSAASAPERVSIGAAVLPPSADDVRAGSPLLRLKFPVPATDPFAVADLRTLVYEATAQVQAITWRLIDTTLGCSAPEGYSCEVVPDALVPVAVQAITRMAERLKVTTDPGLAEQIATGRRLRGFNAGPYSESYFAPGEFARRGASQGRQPMDADDTLDAALWALATEDARDYFVWRATGTPPPAGEASVFDYRRQGLGYGAGSLGFPGGYGHGGPDGF